MRPSVAGAFVPFFGAIFFVTAMSAASIAVPVRTAEGRVNGRWSRRAHDGDDPGGQQIPGRGATIARWGRDFHAKHPVHILRDLRNA